ncbi:MAG: N,N-dimethylformamidase beta subunit family domain-containing protein [Flavobacteriales bacterium]
MTLFKSRFIMYKLINFFICLFFVLVSINCSKNKNYGDAECNNTEIITNTHQVEGYTDKVSYSPGETVEFKIHSKTDNVDIKIYHYGASTNLIHSAIGVNSTKQDYYCRSYSFGCNWETTYQFVVPQSAVSGIYSAHVSNDSNELDYITFVVKKNNSINNDILVMASTNTWQAYNNWDGQSFYKYDLSEETHNSTIVSFHRPNKVDKPIGNSGHLVSAELHLHRWLENNRYGFDVAAEIDLHQNINLLDDYKVVILNVHPEYWTLEMYNHLIYFLNDGGKLMYLGGNGIYWRVALKDNRIEVMKTGDNHSYTEGKGGRFRDLGMPESRHLGVQYTNAGIHTYAPYKVLNSNHWIFDSTGVTNGQLIGETGLNNGKACGGETDKISSSSPSDMWVLAVGTNPDDGGGYMVYYDKPNGSKVFSVGSMTYTGSLTTDTVIHRITKNVLDEFLRLILRFH